MNQKINLKTSENETGQRIDIFLSQKIPAQSRSNIKRLIKKGNLEVNGEVCLSPKTSISPNSNISIIIPEKEDSPLPEPKNIPLDILYEDDNIIVIDKPYNMVVHPGDGNEKNTIVNALLWKFADFADTFEDKYRPGIVHRLDKDTTGCLLVSKNQLILEKLIQSFKNNKVKKSYLTLVSGHLENKNGTIKTPIGRHPVNRKKMAVVTQGGKKAISHYEVIKEGYFEEKKISLLKVKIETGRTHQIRVHLSSINKPVLGDLTYGGKSKFPIRRQMLHALSLSLPHPVSDRIMNFNSPIPDDMQNLIDSI